MKRLRNWSFVLMIVILGSYGVYYYSHLPSSTLGAGIEMIDSSTIETTKADNLPVKRDSVVIKYKYVKIPIIAEMPDSAFPKSADAGIVAIRTDSDSVSISIPYSQNQYETEDYRAYVSGYDARLDSIILTSRVTTIKLKERSRPKRFSVGLQVGYGLTPKGFQPYIGAGVSVNIASF